MTYLTDKQKLKRALELLNSLYELKDAYPVSSKMSNLMINLGAFLQQISKKLPVDKQEVVIWTKLKRFVAIFHEGTSRFEILSNNNSPDFGFVPVEDVVRWAELPT